jgi:hypothetical protein
MNIRTVWVDWKRVRMVTGFAAIAAVGFVIGCAYAAQPHLENALGALQNARHELQVAEHNKGGHRATALRLVDEAIGEVRAGIRAGM